MNNIGNLPKLGNPRLALLQKQLRYSRKNTTINNDKLKASLERFEKSMDKRKQSEAFGAWQKIVPVKNTLREMGALKKCLRKRREDGGLDEGMSPRNGVYDGASLDSMKPEVKDIISRAEPSYRRKKKVDKLKSVGYKQGMLVDYEDSLDKFFNVLTRPKMKSTTAAYGLSPRYSLMRREPLLGHQSLHSAVFTSSDDVSECDESVVQRRSASVDSARTLRLPPIQAVSDNNTLPDTASCTETKDTRLPYLMRRMSSFGPY